MDSITFQDKLRQDFLNKNGSTEYKKFCRILFKINDLLIKGGLEYKIILQSLEKYATDRKEDLKTFYNSKEGKFHYQSFRHALRCNIARRLTGESCRGFSIRLEDSYALQWFTNTNQLIARQGTSKSSIDRYEKYFSAEMLAKNMYEWLASLADTNKAQESGIPQAIEFKNVFTDSTCVKANIHFPVDWVLLKDGVKSLILAIKTIRKHGLKNRMIEPQNFLKNINSLSIDMTHTRKQKDGKKKRKLIFRKMKKLSNCVKKHAERYRELIANQWQTTNLSQAQAQQIINRMDKVLEQLPKAIHQANERIIGERSVPNDKKILSLHDANAQVIVRGKSGNEVEFGQGLLLTEQKDGLIIDCKLFDEQPLCDSKLLQPALKRIKENYGNIETICADRGFSSKQNEDFLLKNEIHSAICPRNPAQLKEKLSEELFASLQTRRSQTEARIGIFKNVFLKMCRSQIAKYKQIAVALGMLVHNLWLLASKAFDLEGSALPKVT